MSNVRSTRQHPEYCLLDKDGKEEALLVMVTRKEAKEWFEKNHPGRQVYRRSGNLFDGFTYKEVEL